LDGEAPGHRCFLRTRRRRRRRRRRRSRRSRRRNFGDRLESCGRSLRSRGGRRPSPPWESPPGGENLGRVTPSSSRGSRIAGWVPTAALLAGCRYRFGPAACSPRAAALSATLHTPGPVPRRCAAAPASPVATLPAAASAPPRPPLRRTERRPVPSRVLHLPLEHQAERLSRSSTPTDIGARHTFRINAHTGAWSCFLDATSVECLFSIG